MTIAFTKMRLAIGGATAVGVVAVLLIPNLRPAALPLAATATLSAAAGTGALSPDPTFSLAASPSPSETSRSTATPRVINGGLATLRAPTLLADKDLPAGAAKVSFTNIRRYDLTELPPRLVSDCGQTLLAIDENAFAFSVYEKDGVSPSTWVADLRTGNLKKVFSNAQLVDVSAATGLLLVKAPAEYVLSATWDPVLRRTFYAIDARTGELRGHFELVEPARAIFLNDGNV